jgi:hypothetical protein
MTPEEREDLENIRLEIAKAQEKLGIIDQEN